jgi:hypothetical protein
MDIPLSLLLAHWVGDWLLQTDWQATNKSKSNYALLSHVGTMGVPLFVWALWWYGPTELAVSFWLLNFVAHFATDWVTSRITSRLWFVRVIEPYNGPGQKFYGAFDVGNRHWFFVTIGFDQLLHFTAFALILRLLA